MDEVRLWKSGWGRTVGTADDGNVLFFMSCYTSDRTYFSWGPEAGRSVLSNRKLKAHVLHGQEMASVRNSSALVLPDECSCMTEMGCTSIRTSATPWQLLASVRTNTSGKAVAQLLSWFPALYSMHRALDP